MLSNRQMRYIPQLQDEPPQDYEWEVYGDDDTIYASTSFSAGGNFYACTVEKISIADDLKNVIESKFTSKVVDDAFFFKFDNMLNILWSKSGDFRDFTKTTLSDVGYGKNILTRDTLSELFNHVIYSVKSFMEFFGVSIVFGVGDTDHLHDYYVKYASLITSKGIGISVDEWDVSDLDLGHQSFLVIRPSKA